MTKADFNVALNLQSTRSTVSTRYYYAVANNFGRTMTHNLGTIDFICLCPRLQVGTPRSPSPKGFLDDILELL